MIFALDRVKRDERVLGAIKGERERERELGPGHRVHPEGPASLWGGFSIAYHHITVETTSCRC